jgi:hypothetical protein
MNRFSKWASAAVVAVAGLTACGGESGGGGIVGTWAIDTDKTMAPLVDQIWDSTAAVREQMKSITAEQLKMMPAEQRAQIEALGTKEKMKEMMRKEAGNTTFTVKADGTYSGSTAKKDKTSTATGTWKETAGVYTFTPQTDDGKPVTGDKAKPNDGRLQGGYLVLVMTNEDAKSMPGGPDLSKMTVYLKRK